MSLNAQTCTVTSGGDATSENGSVSYSIGQCVYSSFVGTSGFVNQGVQHPFEIAVLTAFEKLEKNNNFVLYYPNNDEKFFLIRVKDHELSNLYYEVYDIRGTLLNSDRIIDSDTKIFTTNYKPGTFFIKIIRTQQEVKLFKVII